MRRVSKRKPEHIMRITTWTVAGIMCAVVSALAQTPSSVEPKGPRPDRVIVSPQGVEVEVGQTLTFKAEAFDAANNRMDVEPSSWFAAPFDVGAAEPNGAVTVFAPGELRVGAIINGKSGFTTIKIKPQKAARIEIAPLTVPLAVGDGVALGATVLTSSSIPRRDATVTWVSESPAIASVDSAGFVSGVAPGKATIRARSDEATSVTTVEVVTNPVTAVAVEPKTSSVRTGDVVHFHAQVSGSNGALSTTPAIRWSVSGEGATIEPDGGFVAEQPGSYVITATSGDRAAAASVVVTRRGAERELEVVGRPPLEEFQTLEQ